LDGLPTHPRPPAPLGGGIARRRTARHRRAALAAAWATGAVLALPAAAKEAESPAAPETAAGKDAALPLWEAGIYSIGAWQPAYPGSDQNLTSSQLLPYAIYRGSMLRVEGGGLGVRALQTPRFDWDVSASGSFGSSANQVRVREGMPDIGTLVQFGPAFRINLGDLVDPARDSRLTRLEFPVRAVFDVYDSFHYKGLTFEPRFSHTAWQGTSSSAVVSASMLFGTRSINDLFYGVAPAYATAARPAYEARPGLISAVLSGYVRHRITPSLQVTFFANVETVRNSANHASPLLIRDEDGGFGVALSWAIWQSDEKGTE
jgi:outer membrane scaffolding protein for murein synthesis (MipA/OmpV family)